MDEGFRCPPKLSVFASELTHNNSSTFMLRRAAEGTNDTTKKLLAIEKYRRRAVQEQLEIFAPPVALSKTESKALYKLESATQSASSISVATTTTPTTAPEPKPPTTEDKASQNSDSELPSQLELLKMVKGLEKKKHKYKTKYLFAKEEIRALEERVMKEEEETNSKETNSVDKNKTEIETS